MKDHVLGGDPRWQLALEVPGNRLRLPFRERLRRQYMLPLRRADPPRACASTAHRASMAVAADKRQARQRDPELRRDDVDDALAWIADIEEVERILARTGAG